MSSLKRFWLSGALVAAYLASTSLLLRMTVHQGLVTPRATFDPALVTVTALTLTLRFVVIFVVPAIVIFGAYGLTRDRFRVGPRRQDR